MRRLRQGSQQAADNRELAVSSSPGSVNRNGNEGGHSHTECLFKLSHFNLECTPPLATSQPRQVWSNKYNKDLCMSNNFFKCVSWSHLNIFIAYLDCRSYWAVGLVPMWQCDTISGLRPAGDDGNAMTNGCKPAAPAWSVMSGNIFPYKYWKVKNTVHLMDGQSDP